MRTKRSILLIEDNPGDVRIIRELVSEFQFLTVEIFAINRLDEIEKLETPFDLVLLDLHLPELSGADLFDEIHNFFSKVPIIILTGKNDNELAQFLVRQGAEDYLIKDHIDSYLLERAIFYAMERHKFNQKKLAEEISFREKNELLQVNNKLNKLLHNLEKSNQRLEELTYNAAHHLSAPAINLQHLMRIYKDTHIEKKGFMNNLESSINQLNVKVQDFIEVLSCLTKKNTPCEVVSFHNVLACTQNRLQDRIKVLKPTWRVDFARATTIHFPKSVMEQVFYELILNALLYRDPNRPLEISLSSDRSQDSICLDIGDNGKGMNFLSRQNGVFEMYSIRDENSTGRGIGLYKVRTQLEALDSTIMVKSTSPLGTLLHLRLKSHETAHAWNEET